MSDLGSITLSVTAPDQIFEAYRRVHGQLPQGDPDEVARAVHNWSVSVEGRLTEAQFRALARGPLKPPHGAPCNNCGICCTLSVCWIGELIVGPEAKAPCPALIESGGGFYCGLMSRPQDFRPEQAKVVGIAAMQKAAQELIGAGDGCEGQYVDEPRNPRMRASGLMKLNSREIIKRLQVWGLSRKQSIAFLQKYEAEITEAKARWSAYLVRLRGNRSLAVRSGEEVDAAITARR